MCRAHQDNDQTKQVDEYMESDINKTTPSKEKFDPAAEMHKTLDILVERGQIVELRVLNAKYLNAYREQTYSGYYDNMTRLVEDALKFNGRAPGLYITLNPCHPSLIARRINRFVASPKHSTSEQWILKRRFVPFDIDPLRPAGISASDEEHELAIKMAWKILKWARERGFPDPILGDSGNGAHLLWRVDMPNDDKSKKKIENFQGAVAKEFNTGEGIEVQCFSDANRIWKLYGSLCCKGDNHPIWRHRNSKLIYVPDVVEVLD